MHLQRASFPSHAASPKTQIHEFTGYLRLCGAPYYPLCGWISLQLREQRPWKPRTPSVNEEPSHCRNILEATSNCRILVRDVKVGRLHPSSLGPLPALGAAMPRRIEGQLSYVHLGYIIMGGRKLPSKFTGHNIFRDAFNSLTREGCSRDVLHVNFRPGLGTTSLFI